MKVELSSEKDFAVFKKWSDYDRLEELTCRPIVNEKRIPKSDKVEFLSFFVEGYDNPVGKFTYFDLRKK
jgi:hypothetical protein